jgi:hypothetical protein
LPLGILLLSFLLALTGCASAEPDGDGESESNPTTTGDRISVAPTDGLLSLAFGLDSSAAGTDRVGAVDIAANSGTLELQGVVLDAVVYEEIPWPDLGYALYQGLAVAPDQLAVFWLYCQDGDLNWIYAETTAGQPLFVEEASGTCDVSAEPTATPIVLPALDMGIPNLVRGFTVDGDQVQVDGEGRGSLTVAGEPMELFVFGTVDCTEDCGDPGWWELHTLVYDRESLRMCFAILYLFIDPAAAGVIGVEYSLTLPDLADPIGSQQLAATWTLDSAAGN